MTKHSPRLHYGYVIVACCCLMMGVNVGLTFSCAGIFYRPVSESLGVAVGDFGLYMSIMYITSTLMLSVAGKMVERFSARWLFSGSSLVMGLAFAGMAVADRLWQFYVAGGVLGVTLAFLLYLSFPTMVNRWFVTRVGVMIGICSAASGIGGMLFNPLAGWVMATWGWRWAYASFAVLTGLVVTPLLAWLLRDRPADKGLRPFGSDTLAQTAARAGSAPAATGATYAQATRSPLFYLLIVFAFVMMGTSTLNLFIPGYITDHGFSLEQASLTAAAVMAGVTVGKLALGWINDRNCMAGVAVTTLFGIGGLALLLVGGGAFAVMTGGAFLFGWAYAGVTVQTAMLTRSVFGSLDYARIYSVISIALAAGGALASGGWGLLADAFGTPFAFTIGIGCLGGCLAIGYLSMRSAPKAASGGTAAA